MSSPATLQQDRRRLIAAAAVACLPGIGRAADVSRWMPYDLADIKTLMPATNGPRHGMAGESLQPGMKRIGPAPRSASAMVPTRPSASASSARSSPALVERMLRQPPTAYVLTGQQSAVPAWLLYGVALQESQLAFGRETVPFPWTLCVRGRGERHPSYESVREALLRYLRQGITNVDCGAMQVNWHYHNDKLKTVDRALDPYPNLAVGAAILKNHYRATGDWRLAVGLYHTGSLGGSERTARAARYAEGVSRRLARHGLSLAEASRLVLVPSPAVTTGGRLG